MQSTHRRCQRHHCQRPQLRQTPGGWRWWCSPQQKRRHSGTAGCCWSLDSEGRRGSSMLYPKPRGPRGEELPCALSGSAPHATPYINPTPTQMGRARGRTWAAEVSSIARARACTREQPRGVAVRPGWALSNDAPGAVVPQDADGLRVPAARSRRQAPLIRGSRGKRRASTLPAIAPIATLSGWIKTAHTVA